MKGQRALRRIESTTAVGESLDEEKETTTTEEMGEQKWVWGVQKGGTWYCI